MNCVKFSRSFFVLIASVFVCNFSFGGDVSVEEKYLVDNFVKCVAKKNNERWPLYQDYFNHEKVLKTIFIPTNPLIQDAFSYRLLLIADDLYLIERYGGFAGARTIFGPCRSSDFCVCN